MATIRPGGGGGRREGGLYPRGAFADRETHPHRAASIVDERRR